MRFFARVDNIVGVLGSLEMHLPTEDVNLKIVEVLTDDYEFEQRTTLYRDNITRAEIEAIVKQRHTIMSRGASTKVRNVGQALIAIKPGRRNRKQEGSGKGGRAGKGVTDDVVAAKNDNSSSTKAGKYDDMRNKCHRCLQPGHRWFNCTAHVIPAAKKSQNGSGEIIRSLAIGVLGERDAEGGREQGTDGTEKWIANSGATFHIPRSDYLLRDVQPSEDKVKIGNVTLVDVEGYGSLTAVFPNKAEGVTVRLDKVAYVPSLVLNLFYLMAAHTRGVGFATADKDMGVTLADGRLKFWGDGSGYCNYGRRIGPDND